MHNFLGFCACTLLMSYALYAEHFLGLEPCPMCIFQRISTILLGLTFLVGCFPFNSRFSRLLIGSLILITSLSGILVASRHVLLQNLPRDALPDGSPIREKLATFKRPRKFKTSENDFSHGSFFLRIGGISKCRVQNMKIEFPLFRKILLGDNAQYLV